MIKALKKLGKIPTYLYKNCDLFLETVTVCVNEALKAGFFHDSLKCANEALKAGFLHNSLKCANVRRLYKNDDPLIKRIVDQWVYYHFYQKFMKEWYMNKHQIILNLFRWNFVWI